MAPSSQPARPQPGSPAAAGFSPTGAGFRPIVVSPVLLNSSGAGAAAAALAAGKTPVRVLAVHQAKPNTPVLRTIARPAGSATPSPPTPAEERHFLAREVTPPGPCLSQVPNRRASASAAALAELKAQLGGLRKDLLGVRASINCQLSKEASLEEVTQDLYGEVDVLRGARGLRRRGAEAAL